MAYIVACSCPRLGSAWAGVTSCLRRNRRQVHKQLNDNNIRKPEKEGKGK